MWFRKISIGSQQSVFVILGLVAYLFSINIANNGVEGCSFRCPTGDEYRICVNSEVGRIGADCSGFEGCFNSSTPCNDECPVSKPVLSEDKLTCLKCYVGLDGNTTCPNCTDQTIWCKIEAKCKNREEVCGGTCNSAYFPILSDDGEHCQRCPEGNTWCARPFYPAWGCSQWRDSCRAAHIAPGCQLS